MPEAEQWRGRGGRYSYCQNWRTIHLHIVQGAGMGSRSTDREVCLFSSHATAGRDEQCLGITFAFHLPLCYAFKPSTLLCALYSLLGPRRSVTTQFAHEDFVRGGRDSIRLADEVNLALGLGQASNVQRKAKVFSRVLPLGYKGLDGCREGRELVRDRQSMECHITQSANSSLKVGRGLD